MRYLARHVGEGLPQAQRVRLFAAGVAAGERCFKRVVALQCVGAARLADRLGMTEGVREGLGHVYERWDGKGAPSGLAGEHVSLAQRVVIVAHDAVVHARLNGLPSALDWIRRRRGDAYDPVRAALRAEVEGGRFDQRAVNAVLAAAGDRPVHAREAWPAWLSDRAVEVLRLVARGKTNRQIAAELVIAEKTVGRHVENLYAKAGLSTRAGAALFAAEHELLG